jgi:hypothetical protein
LYHTHSNEIHFTGVTSIYTYINRKDGNLANTFLAFVDVKAYDNVKR